MSSAKCPQCSKPALVGKSHCLEHHKEQQNYTYGLDHDLQQKIAGKYDPQKAAAALAWVSAVTKRQLPADLHEALKSGTVLCELVNAIWPGSVPKINQGSMPFVQRENLVNYINACKAKGMRETDCFVTGDLYEAANLGAVVDQICALGQLSNQKGFKGPALVISGGAVQVASPTAAFKVAPPPQVDMFAKSPAASAAPSHIQAPAPAAAAKPAPAPAATAAPSPPAGGAKFCGGCGTPRADQSVKFCGNCGGKF